jgi:hypothetical protein
MVAAAVTDLELPFELPLELASLPPELRAVELRRLGDLFHAKADVLDGGSLTVQEAAETIGRSEENVRQWVRRFGIGYFDRTSGRYVISRSKLAAHMLAAYGRLPHGLVRK